MFSFSLMMLSHALKKSRAYGSMLDFSRLENGSTTTGVAGTFFQNVKPPTKTCESTGSNQKKKRLQYSWITTAQVIFSRMGETNESLTRKSAAWSDLISDPPSLIWSLILHSYYNKIFFYGRFMFLHQEVHTSTKGKSSERLCRDWADCARLCP